MRTVRKSGEEVYTRSFMYDVNGKRTRDYDSYGRLVTQIHYDKLGRSMRTIGMDEGEAWILLDAAGSDLFAWNCRGYVTRIQYDALHRETERLVRNSSGPEQLITRTTYGEGQIDATYQNLNNQIWKIEDQAGVHVNDQFDIRGRCVARTTQYAQEYKEVVDWNINNKLEAEILSSSYTYDSFGHVLQEEDAQGNQTHRKYTRLGQVRAVAVAPKKSQEWKTYLSNATFEADGQTAKMKYGNGVTTEFTYDCETRLLLSKRTSRTRKGKVEVLEDLAHTYDCCGRRVFASDASEQAKYSKGAWVQPEWDWSFNVKGELVAASGRAQFSNTLQVSNRLTPHRAGTGSVTERGITNGNLLYRYLETYDYDLEGNLEWMKHDAPDVKGVTSWIRKYHYEEQSLLSTDPLVKSNRLSRTTIGEKDEHEGAFGYDGDAGLAGCMTTMPTFTKLGWDMNDRLSSSSTQIMNAAIPEMTYYVYNHQGRRARKVTESARTGGELPRKLKDTFYFDNLELQRAGSGGELWIADVVGDSILALVEDSSKTQSVLDRYRVGDSMELDDEGQLISYEEYSPFGAVVYTAVYRQVEADRKYRFAKYEHDRETGLYHCGHRYYCPWLGRWTSPDPMGDIDGPNLYIYAGNDPVNNHDPAGTSFKAVQDLDPSPKPELNLPKLEVTGRRKAISLAPDYRRGSNTLPPIMNKTKLQQKASDQAENFKEKRNEAGKLGSFYTGLAKHALGKEGSLAKEATAQVFATPSEALFRTVDKLLKVDSFASMLNDQDLYIGTNGYTTKGQLATLKNVVKDVAAYQKLLEDSAKDEKVPVYESIPVRYFNHRVGNFVTTSKSVATNMTPGQAQAFTHRRNHRVAAIERVKGTLTKVKGYMNAAEDQIGLQQKYHAKWQAQKQQAVKIK